MNLEELTRERDELITRGTEIADKIASGEVSDDDRSAMRTTADRLAEIKSAIAEGEKDDAAIASVRSAATDAEANRARKPVFTKDDKGPKIEVNEPTSIGAAFTRSQGYQDWLSRFPQGGPARGSYTSESVSVGALRNAMNVGGYSARTIITSDAASAGDLVLSDRRGLIEPGLVRPLTVRDLVTVIPTGTDSIEWVKETSRTSAAASVDEATALTGTSGLKPEGGLVFDVVTDSVITIAEWVPATTRIMADARGLGAYINAYLGDDLAVELEDQMVSGAGGSDLTGLLNAGIGTTSGGASVLYDIRTAIRKVRVDGRSIPNAVLMNPEDAEAMDLLEIAAEANRFVGPGPYGPAIRTVWGLPLVECEGITAGTAIVGDFRKAILWDREQTSISVGTVDDDFVRNIVRVLGEIRVGFSVTRPAAFCSITGL